MTNTVQTRMRLTPADKAAIRAYWEFVEPHARAVMAELRASLLELPEWAPIIRGMSEAEHNRREEESRARQRRAAIDDVWTPYIEELHERGIEYARLGVSFVAWYDAIAINRELVRRRLVALVHEDAAAGSLVDTGMNRFIDIAIGHIGEAYLSAKEQIIARQAQAIRELSLPVLQVRDRLLIVPLVGLIDSARARLLIETLLAAIRDKRACGVVIDVTGVPIVDTAVANHLVQACDAAHLMGATVVITGISPEMAQTLVALGAKVPAAETLVDLQEGIDHIERALGYRDGSDAPLQVSEHQA